MEDQYTKLCIANTINFIRHDPTYFIKWWENKYRSLFAPILLWYESIHNWSRTRQRKNRATSATIYQELHSLIGSYCFSTLSHILSENSSFKLEDIFTKPSASRPIAIKANEVHLPFLPTEQNVTQGTLDKVLLSFLSDTYNSEKGIIIDQNSKNSRITFRERAQ